jgi:GNAT superfamily N-acetyltransferase
MASEPVLVVRRVSGVDLRATLELLVNQQRAHGNDLTEDELRPVVQDTLEDSTRTLVLGAFHEGLPGFAHGKMVGVLMMTVTISLEQAGEVGWIDELFVRSDYRKKGLAQRMLSMALGWAEARGLRTIDLEVGEKHEPAPATRLYQQQGFQRINRARLTLRLARPKKSS